MSCAVAAHPAGPAVNPYPPDPAASAEARRLNRWGITDQEWTELTLVLSEETPGS